MALNPFFLQGSPGEQRLVQELINEQLKIYGVDVTYIPRKFVRRETILEEISSSKFDDNYTIEAYISSYDGYSGQGDILTKFGMSLRDELILIISRERFEDFIVPFLGALENDDQLEVSTRPREGDLIYFPLGQRIFEVKFVEHEQPFYQLGKNYIYELKCELFEYEDEVIDTSIDEIDNQLQDQGHIYTINVVGTGKTASASASISTVTGYITEFFINQDGYGYNKQPSVVISPSPLGSQFDAKAVAITTSKGGSRSLKEIVFISAGLGYTTPPTVSIVGGGGSGAAVTCNIATRSAGIYQINILDSGSGYRIPPQITISSPVGSGLTVGLGITATAIANVSASSTISSIYIKNPGIGYTTDSNLIPSISIAPPPLITGIGTFLVNEQVFGQTSLAVGRVKEWNAATRKLKVTSDGQFYPGEIIIGAASSATFSVFSYENWNVYDKYNQNLEIEQAASNILDFSESNPFGTY